MTLNWTELNDSFEGDGSPDGTGADPATAATQGTESTGDPGAPKGDPGTAKKTSDAEAALLKEVMEKKEALKKAKDAAKALEDQKNELASQLAKFQGIDLDEVQTLFKEKKERELAKLEEKGEWDRLKAQMLEAHTKELETVRGESTTKVSELESVLANMRREIHELTIGRSFSESSYIRDDLTLTPAKARIIYGGHFELQDGKIVAYDKPAGAENRTMFIDGDGEPLAFDKAMQKLVELDPDRDNLLRSKIRAGSGSDNDPDGKSKMRQPELRGKDRILAADKSGALKPAK